MNIDTCICTPTYTYTHHTWGGTVMRACKAMVAVVVVEALREKYRDTYIIHGMRRGTKY